ncbi:hypothetical protein M8C21_031844 [Ambrosia artemisiifolia]|uniref:Uncharacterized protein n=1 Tax=Ambrosia artemisiifolia TaxID=4212 RepID=A0AAD5C1S4_AMBAR|nr:hypothetical protein M8C21_031844 [Ambrosia artemisiifolia]
MQTFIELFIFLSQILTPFGISRLLQKRIATCTSFGSLSVSYGWIKSAYGAQGTLCANEKYQLQVDLPKHYVMEASQIRFLLLATDVSYEGMEWRWREARIHVRCLEGNWLLRWKNAGGWLGTRTQSEHVDFSYWLNRLSGLQKVQICNINLSFIFDNFETGQIGVCWHL